ncbi:tyrosine-type recombinase/integrase [Bordetella avium]|uniref:tyrosine-type recombinase/integrase n=1 Tax=Bordetella avium TaxID=521 RepID=UPI000E12EE42|nr:site-specific integrase [Bordetella avium]UOK17501.1 integrase [Bordetella phage vB_BaM-IFTN8]WQE34663.1 site-specific integrase [Bordetella avium]SUV68301.1 integrase [Bordetella avium]
MPIYRDKARGCFVFEFDRAIEGKRVRTSKLLPKSWSRAQADAYDRQEAARLYAVATRVERPQFLIEDAVTIYLKERAPHLKSGDIIIRELGLMYWAYRGKPISELAEACKLYGEKAIRDDGSELAPATKRNRIRYLVSACRYAWKRHGMSEHDPGARVLTPTVRNERQFYTDRRGMLLIAKACTCKATRAAIRISFYSGMRLGEVVAAVREDGLFKLPDTKNGLPRFVPIHPKANAAAKVRMRDKWTMSKNFKKAARAVGMGHLRFHDLRHSAASEMINASVDLYTVGAVLGHKSATSTKRYAHLATETIGGALANIGRKSPDAKKQRVA